MNRKSFFRNLFGAVAATVVGNKLDFIPEPQGIKPPIVNKMKRYKKEWSVGEEKNIIVQNGRWMDKAMWEAHTKWLHEQEMAYWYGKPLKSKV